MHCKLKAPHTQLPAAHHGLHEGCSKLRCRDLRRSAAAAAAAAASAACCRAGRLGGRKLLGCRIELRGLPVRGCATAVAAALQAVWKHFHEGQAGRQLRWRRRPWPVCARQVMEGRGRRPRRRGRPSRGPGRRRPHGRLHAGVVPRVDSRRWHGHARAVGRRLRRRCPQRAHGAAHAVGSDLLLCRRRRLLRLCWSSWGRSLAGARRLRRAPHEERRARRPCDLRRRCLLSRSRRRMGHCLRREVCKRRLRRRSGRRGAAMQRDGHQAGAAGCGAAEQRVLSRARLLLRGEQQRGLQVEEGCRQ